MSQHVWQTHFFSFSYYHCQSSVVFLTLSLILTLSCISFCCYLLFINILHIIYKYKYIQPLPLYIYTIDNTKLSLVRSVILIAIQTFTTQRVHKVKLKKEKSFTSYSLKDPFFLVAVVVVGFYMFFFYVALI